MSHGLTIPPELDAEMTPAVRTFVKLLLGRIAQQDAETAELKARLAKYEKFERPSGPQSRSSRRPTHRRVRQRRTPLVASEVHNLVISDTCGSSFRPSSVIRSSSSNQRTAVAVAQNFLVLIRPRFVTRSLSFQRFACTSLNTNCIDWRVPAAVDRRVRIFRQEFLPARAVLGWLPSHHF